MLREWITGAPAVVAALIALTLAITAYLNTSTVPTEWERRTVLHRQFILTDSNGDGFMGRDEAAAIYRREFAGLDFDRDGAASRDEFIGLRESWARYHVTERWKVIQANREAAFVKVDRNRDGLIMEDEYVEHSLAAIYMAMDTDGDRKVSRSEFMAGMGLR